jgi:hypothetical protein
MTSWRALVSPPATDRFLNSWHRTNSVILTYQEGRNNHERQTGTPYDQDVEDYGCSTHFVLFERNRFQFFEEVLKFLKQ